QILTPYIGLKLAKKHNIPFIYYWTDVYHAQIPLKLYQPLGKMIEKKILKESDAIIVINDVLKDFVMDLGSDPEKTYVEKAGIDFNRFDSKITGESVRKKYGIQKEDNVLLFVGWLYNFSGLQEVVREVCKLKDKYTNIKFMIVGEGDALKELKAIVNRYDIHENVILTGKQPYESIPQFIAAADICLLPSHNNDIMKDIVPIKFYEYMAMGKPVISTKLPGVIREFGDNGIIYADTPKDVLKTAIQLLKNNRIKIEGKKAEKFVSKNDWEQIVYHFENLINR
ncbi:MAG: glycosyltransferase family 4 protein, partial [Methanobacterium sp.]|nr:glycosyltransferase family 4 protein [Methanobacterium sp.]